MQESENQVLTAKAEGETATTAATPAPKKKGKRALWIVLAVLGACLLLGFGALVGGGAVYGLTRARSRTYVAPSVERWVLPREMPHRDLPGLPGRGMMVWGTGALIVEVVPDSPADQAGLSEGDLVVAFDGEALDAESDLAAQIAQHKPGDTVTLEVESLGSRLRQGSREMTVTLGEHPEDKGKAYLGVTFVPTADGELGPGRGMFWFQEFDGDGSCEGCDDTLGDRIRDRLFEFRRSRR